MSEIVVFLKEWLPTAAVGIVPVYLFLKQDIRHAKESAAKDFGNIEKLLDRDRASLNEKFGHIDKQLSNHITETNDKIKELQADVKGLKSGQAALEVKIEKGQAALEVKNAERHAELAEGQAKLEVKIADGHAELYKLLSSKIPDKKQ